MWEFILDIDWHEKIQVMTQQSNTRIEKTYNISQNDFQITYNKVLKQKLNYFQRFDAANQSSSLSDMLKSCLKTANFALFSSYFYNKIICQHLTNL